LSRPTLYTNADRVLAAAVLALREVRTGRPIKSGKYRPKPLEAEQ
jgi:hypothetical protein